MQPSPARAMRRHLGPALFFSLLSPVSPAPPNPNSALGSFASNHKPLPFIQLQTDDYTEVKPRLWSESPFPCSARFVDPTRFRRYAQYSNRYFARIHAPDPPDRGNPLPCDVGGTHAAARWVAFSRGTQPSFPTFLADPVFPWSIGYVVPPYTPLLFAIGKGTHEDKELQKADLDDLAMSLIANPQQPVTQHTQSLVEFFNSLENNTVGADAQTIAVYDTILRNPLPEFWHNTFIQLPLSTQSAVVVFMQDIADMWRNVCQNFARLLEEMYPASEARIAGLFLSWATAYWNDTLEYIMYLVEWGLQPRSRRVEFRRVEDCWSKTYGRISQKQYDDGEDMPASDLSICLRSDGQSDTDEDAEAVADSCKTDR